MPNKTIYVSDEDLPLFEQAQQIAGEKLSAVIVRSLKRFVEIEEARKGGFEEITLMVGTPGAIQRKRFIGVRLVRWLRERGEGTAVISVYQTAKKRLVLHVRVIPDWKLEWGDPEHWRETTKGWGVFNKLFSWDAYKDTGEYTFEVFENVEELKAHVPEDLYKAVKQALDAPPLEDLDI